MSKHFLILSTVLAINLLQADAASRMPKVELNPHRLSFSFNQLGFDYIKKDAIYAGADFRISPIWNPNDKKLDLKDYFANGEVRLGHTFGMSDSDTLISYGALGYTQFHRNYADNYLKEMCYFSVGAKFLHEFGSIFELGVHVKASRILSNIYTLKYFHSGQTIETTKWSYEFGLPLIFHIGKERQWEIQLEPYYTRIRAAIGFELLGSKLTFGFRF